MLVSVIIASFRQPQFLWRAIESCLEQDHADLEVIVVDDRSRDSSLGLALSYAARDARVRVVECRENGGLGKTRNIGLAHARGEYVCFLDSDDYLLDRSISARVDALAGAHESHGASVVGVYGDWQHVGESIDYPNVRAARATMPLVSADTYTGENVFICSAPLVQRLAVVDAGGFPEGLRMLEDFALWARMLCNGAIFVPVHHVVATYRQRPNSMLRGDGGVVMADHVAVINDWTKAHGVSLTDGGAMEAWLTGLKPYSHGRMSWNVPSVLGNFGGAPGAAAVQAGVDLVRAAAPEPLDDFMTNPVTSGLADVDQTWASNVPGKPTMAIVVRDLEQSLTAVGIVDEFATNSITIAVYTDDPEDWAVTWPLSLANIAVQPVSAIERMVEQPILVDLDAPDHQFAETAGLVDRAVELLWRGGSSRTKSVVFVPASLDNYPALDAWTTTALRSLAEVGLDPTVMAEPSMRGQLAGFRTSLTSIEELKTASLVVAPSGSHLGWLERVAAVVVFDPSNPSGDHARTAGELRRALGR